MAHLKLLAESLKQRIYASVLAADFGNLYLRETVFAVFTFGNFALHVPRHLLLPKDQLNA